MCSPSSRSRAPHAARWARPSRRRQKRRWKAVRDDTRNPYLLRRPNRRRRHRSRAGLHLLERQWLRHRHPGPRGLHRRLGSLHRSANGSLHQGGGDRLDSDPRRETHAGAGAALVPKAAGGGVQAMSEEETKAAVTITFKSSSSKDGKEGYVTTVTSDATEADVDRTATLAARARQAALKELAGEGKRLPRKER